MLDGCKLTEVESIAGFRCKSQQKVSDREGLFAVILINTCLACILSFRNRQVFILVANSLFPLSLLSVCRTVHYYAELGQCSVFSTSDVPEHFVGQVTVLKYFAHYMEENLMDVSLASPLILYSSLFLSCCSYLQQPLYSIFPLNFFLLLPSHFFCLLPGPFFLSPPPGPLLRSTLLSFSFYPFLSSIHLFPFLDFSQSNDVPVFAV